MQHHNSKITEMFSWDDRSSLECWTKNSTDGSADNSMGGAVATTIHGVLFVADTHSVDALKTIRTALHDQLEFCVYPQTAPVDANENASKKARLGTSGYFRCMSGGSNGKPKQIRRTHASWLASFNITAANANITPNDNYAIVGKLSHSLALYAALEAVNLGANVHAFGDLRPDNQILAIHTLGSTILYATPTQLRLLCNQANRLNLSNFKVRRVFCGGGKLDEKTKAMLADCFTNATVQEFYGATESSFITISNQDTPIGSVGKAYPGVTLTIVGARGNTPQTAGEIHVKSPYLFSEYAHASDDAVASDKHHVADNVSEAIWHGDFLSIGEHGYLDEEGNLFLAGRINRRANVADQLVFPEEIENTLNEHEAVRACAVIPVDDEQRGQVLVAVVESNSKLNESQELLTYLRKHFGNLKAPRKIIYVDQLPLLASGKPDLIAAIRIATRNE